MMRFTLRMATLVLVLLMALPLAAQADGGPCPDDPVGAANCADQTPPYYVVVNRSVEHFDRPATGCQPLILKHPECTDCPTCNIDIQQEVCRYLPAAPGDTLYAMCCNCATNPNGDWMYRVYQLDGAGGCTMTQDWTPGLPPNTGVNLPVPFIAGGLAVLGVGLLAAGVVVKRRYRRLPI